jgi:CheY-like chemotaxis protein
MNCLILSSSPAERESLAYILLPIGVKAVPASSKKEALEIIEKDSQVVSAIVDVDNREIEGSELIKELRENPDTKHIKIIIHSVQSGRDFVVGFVETGIHGYLLKPLDQQKATQKLKEVLIDRAPLQHEKRQHIRVNPDPGELLRMHFRVPGLTALISGKIRNISMGGVALELFNPPDEKALRPGVRIPTLQFNLGTNSLSPSGHVVLFKEKLLAIRFGPLSAEDRNNLARYIYKKLSVPAATSESD